MHIVGSIGLKWIRKWLISTFESRCDNENRICVRSCFKNLWIQNTKWKTKFRALNTPSPTSWMVDPQINNCFFLIIETVLIENWANRIRYTDSILGTYRSCAKSCFEKQQFAICSLFACFNVDVKSNKYL